MGKKQTTTRAPRELGDAGRDYWRTLNETFDLEDQDTPLVTSLCVLIDRLTDIRAAIATQGVTTKDRFGIEQPNKLLEHERSTMLAAGRLWRELGFGSAEDTNPSRMPGARGYK